MALLYAFIRDCISCYVHILAADQQISVIEVIDIRCRKLGIWRGNDAVSEDFGGG